MSYYCSDVNVVQIRYRSRGYAEAGFIRFKGAPYFLIIWSRSTKNFDMFVFCLHIQWCK